MKKIVSFLVVSLLPVLALASDATPVGPGIVIKASASAPTPAGRIRFWYKTGDTSLHLQLANNTDAGAFCSISQTCTLTNKTFLLSSALGLASTVTPKITIASTTAATNVQDEAAPLYESSGTDWSGSASELNRVAFGGVPVAGGDVSFGIFSAIGAGSLALYAKLTHFNGGGVALYGKSGETLYLLNQPAGRGGFAIDPTTTFLRMSGSTAYGWTASAAYPFADAAQDSGIASTNRWNGVWSRYTVVGDTAGNQPTCDVTKRGAVFQLFASNGSSDELRQCMKKADDTYAWVAVKTAP